MQLTRKLNAALAGVAMGAASLTGVAIMAAPAASAASVPAATGTTCKTAAATATITPGIFAHSTGKKHAIKASFKASNCTKVDGATSVKGTIKLSSKNLSCISGSATGTFTSKDNKGATSSGTMTLKATTTPLKFTLSGKVSKGFLKGSKISGTFKATPVKGNCSTTALTKATIKNTGSFKL